MRRTESLCFDAFGKHALGQHLHLFARGGQTRQRSAQLEHLFEPENARRYMQGMAVSLNFVRSFCRAFNVSADWLLEGRGSKDRR